MHQVTEAACLRWYVPAGKVPKGHRGQAGFAMLMQLNSEFSRGLKYIYIPHLHRLGALGRPGPSLEEHL